MKVVFALLLCVSLINLAECARAKIIELKCNPVYDAQRIVNLPYRCVTGLACFFEHIHVDEDTNLLLNFDESNYGLDCIGFVNTTLGELPTNLFNKYRAVNSLYASRVSLKSLPTGTFDNATKLLDINLSHNKLDKLESRVFSNCAYLKKLVLSYNQIEEIDMNAFDQLDHLEELDLSNNALTTVPHKSLGSLLTLKTLNLANNSIIVKYGMFPVSLISLDLSYCKLENFTLKSIINLANLKSLYLNGNRIFRSRLQMFPDGINEPLRSLRYIQLSDNEFYCTTLADIVMWLEKYRISIDVVPHLKIINDSHIRGVGCKEEQKFFY